MNKVSNKGIELVRYKLILITSSILILTLFSSSHAAIYYVSPTGSASWSACTNINTPCSAATAMENAVAGNIVYFRGGTYNPGISNNREIPALNPANSGISASPITFIAYPGEIPVIQSTKAYGAAFGAGHRDYIIWDGFVGNLVDFRIGNKHYGEPQLVGFWSSNGSIIRNCNLTGFIQTDHHNTALIRIENSNNIIVENNKLHDNNGYPEGDANFEETAINTTGILIFFSKNLIIRNNDIYNNYLGIWDKDTEQDNQYYNNHIWGGSTYSTSCKVGIQINNQLDRYGTARGAKAYQNLIRNCATGISIYEDTPLRYNIEIFNNTLHNGLLGKGAGIMSGTTSRDAVIYNNIISGYEIMLRYRSGASMPMYSNFNLFYSSNPRWNLDYKSDYRTLTSWRKETSFDSHSIASNPLFVNPGGTKPEDYMLSHGSPARNAGRYGTDLGAFIKDYGTIIGYQPPQKLLTPELKP